jgi:uncharacterized protein YqeY
MNIQERINNDIKEAMRNKQVDRLAALRAVKSAIMLEMTKDGSSIVSDQISLEIIIKLIKQRRDAANIYRDEKRDDLADEEINQLKHLQEYVPAQMGEESVRIEVKEVIQALEASSISDMGKCMGILINKLKGKAEGSLISRLVKEELEKI